MKAVKQLNIIYLLPCILVSKLTEDCIFVLMRWYNETGGIIQNWATHLSSTPLPFSSAFKLWTASTSHSRSQRVLLPVRRRFPRHSSTPTPRKHINSVSSGRSCISKISLSKLHLCGEMSRYHEHMEDFAYLYQFLLRRLPRSLSSAAF